MCCSYGVHDVVANHRECVEEEYMRCGHVLHSCL